MVYTHDRKMRYVLFHHPEEAPLSSTYFPLQESSTIDECGHPPEFFQPPEIQWFGESILT
jgi:hypothetical protein